jgi:N-acetylglucosamine kinase-like BadF-type ATPase
MDGGGTKTECVAVDLDARAVSRVLGGPSNYQSIGIGQARSVWDDLISRALAPLDASRSDILGAGLGVAGYDRPLDEGRIREAFETLLPQTPLDLMNDAYLALRAGTADGIGVTVVSGTGCNAMGMNCQMERFRVGGLGPEFGDLGSADDIGVEALRRAFRSRDGREPPTLLADMIIEELGLNRLDDLVEFFLFDNQNPGPSPDSTLGPFQFRSGLLAPLVFEAACREDATAIDILIWAGRELALSGLAVCRHLFQRQDSFSLVLGGSVLQKGRSPILRDTLIASVQTEFPNVRPLVLQARPVVGAVLYGVDLAAGIPGAFPLGSNPVDVCSTVLELVKQSGLDP